MGSKIDEVTKHSVHTLVFRSQKRAHEMFISDQGSLPDSEKDLDIHIKRIKAKAYYGNSLVERVNHAKIRKEAYENRPEALTQEIPEESSDKINLEAPANSGSTNMSSNASNQLVAFSGKPRVLWSYDKAKV